MSLVGNVLGFSAFFILMLYFTGCFHVIDYGYIGVYKRGGALLSSWTDPGLHFLIPFLTTYSPVQVTIQTDKVTDIPVDLLSHSAEPVAE
jgi:regulator of protease activity HflC (stomatin/prohibitin superfamily)